MSAAQWLGVLIAVIVAVNLAVLRWLRRHSNRAPLQPLPPAVSPRHPAARRDAEAPRLPGCPPQAAPWPDGDTVVTDGMADAINRMLRGDGAK